ncbi:MAG: hypothetical protein KC561_04200, partial [Myxococcales bacterium]|nr:hypothetical protein [Myxococcales bacterium]
MSANQLKMKLNDFNSIGLQMYRCLLFVIALLSALTGCDEQQPIPRQTDPSSDAAFEIGPWS